MEHKSLLRLVRDQWAVIVVCAVFGVLAGQALAASAVREYTTSSYVYVTVTGSTSTGEAAQSGNFSQQQARNFSAIATREAVLAPVISSLELDMTLNELRRKVATSVPLNTSVITISATDESPERAAAIANAVASYLAEVVPAITPRVGGESPVRLETIESARPPVNPSSPNVPLLMFLGLLAGLVLATVVVVIRGVIDARVRSQAQVTEVTGAAVVGTVSFDRRTPKNPIALIDDGNSLRAEEYRQLRASLRFLQPGKAHKVFVVTSSMPGEGKSSTSANIAASLAASGLQVCLVEADLRRPSLARILDLPAGIGLTSVLTGESSLEDSVFEWGPHGLHVLLAGHTPPNPSEMLESAGTDLLLQSIRDRFDVTVIDCPPLNPVADAAVIARTFGGVLLVVGSRRVRVRELARAAHRLETVGASIEGAILNLAPVSRAGRYRYTYTSEGSKPRGAREPQARAPKDSSEAEDTLQPGGEHRSSWSRLSFSSDASTPHPKTAPTRSVETEVDATQ